VVGCAGGVGGEVCLPRKNIFIYIIFMLYPLPRKKFYVPKIIILHFIIIIIIIFGAF